MAYGAFSELETSITSFRVILKAVEYTFAL